VDRREVNVSLREELQLLAGWLGLRKVIHGTGTR
jgi:hypothetical protein